jgi:hypothetical protein
LGPVKLQLVALKMLNLELQGKVGKVHEVGVARPTHWRSHCVLAMSAIAH